MTDFEILVNKENPLDKDFTPKDMIEINEPTGIKTDPTYVNKLEREAYFMFKKMQKSALEEGYHIFVDSSYRSYEYQCKLFNDVVQKHGMDYAMSSVAMPGYSEHQTGLAVDVIIMRNGSMIESFDESFEEIIWLMNNCYKFGFILRYPKDKEYITGYNFEPWHYRYVGRNISERMFENNIITYEEYVKKYLG